MPLCDGYSTVFIKLLSIRVLDSGLVGCKIYGAKSEMARYCKMH